MKPEVRTLMLEKLNQALTAEQQVLSDLPQLAQSVTSSALQQAFQLHEQQTHRQIERLQRVGDLLGSPLQGAPCEAMQGLSAEASRLMQSHEAGPLRDVVLLCAAQGVEHHEIAVYGTLASLARAAGEDEAADLLTEILEEEKATDAKLTKLAESEVNPAAMQ